MQLQFELEDHFNSSGQCWCYASFTCLWDKVQVLSVNCWWFQSQKISSLCNQPTETRFCFHFYV